MTWRAYSPVTVGLYRNRSVSRLAIAARFCGGGSDRAVRRKPMVRSGQDVWGYGFSTVLITKVAGEES
jgi:hypothetical protein